MSRSLASMLRLRSLLEEESRTKLEKLVRDSSRIEDAQEREEEIASACQNLASSIISEKCGGAAADVGDSATALRIAKDVWQVALVDREVAHLRQQQLASFARLTASRVEAFREELVERRKERLQVENLLRQDALVRARDRERREQRSLDDWFTAARCRRRR
jgi:hypothetical protein